MITSNTDIMARTHKLFISHSWAYGDEYDRLIRLLDSRAYFFYSNYSVPKDDPVHTRGSDRALQEAIFNRIRFCGVVVILGGVYSTYSRWINTEIELAKEAFSNPKPVLAIYPWGSERISSVVRERADMIVGWNTESVVRAIRELDSY